MFSERKEREMHTLRALTGFVAGAFALVAIVRYIWAIFRTAEMPAEQRVRPNRVTWLVISIIGWTLLVYNVAMGATSTLWLPAAYAVGPTIVAFLSIRHGVGGWERSDLIAGAIAGVSLILWWWLGLTAGFAANLVADFAGFWPTIRKAYRSPKSEDAFAWTTTSIGCIINLFALSTLWSGAAVYAVYQLFANGTIAVLASRKQTKLSS